MEKVKVIHDTVGKTLTIWFADSSMEATCEETTDEVVLMKDATGKVIGLELLHYRLAEPIAGLAVETAVQTRGSVGARAELHQAELLADRRAAGRVRKVGKRTIEASPEALLRASAPPR